MAKYMSWAGMRSLPLGISLAVALLLGGNASAAQSTLTERVDRLERLLESQVLNEMLDRVNKLQGEVQQLRGDLEEANHQLRNTKRRQRDLYLDVDRRLHKFERGGVEADAGETTEPAAEAPTEATKTDATKTMPGADPLLEQKAYEQAFKSLADGRHDPAKKGFEAYLNTYPEGTYAGDSQYWLGEIAYQTRDFDAAQAAFNKLISKHPNSSKLSNALLKVGFIYYEKGDMVLAKSTLEKVVNDYKGTTAARLAGNRLKLIKKEGK